MNKIGIITSGILLIMISCKESLISNQKHEIKKYYLFHSHRTNRVDTLKYEDVNRNVGMLNALDSIGFDFQRRYVKIKKLSNLPNAPIDGEFLAYWEKNVGILYGRGLAWSDFYILQTNNDSINKYIMVLMGNMLMNPKMYMTPKEIGSMIKFVPPKIDK